MRPPVWNIPLGGEINLGFTVGELLWDILWTVVEACYQCYLCRAFIRKKHTYCQDLLTVAIITALAEILTFIHVHTLIKFMVMFVLIAVVFKIIYRLDFLTGCMIYACFSVAQVLAELCVSTVMNLFDLQFLNDGNTPIYYLAYLYVPVHLVSALFVVLERKILMNIKDALSPKMAGGITLVLFGCIVLFLLISMNLDAFDGIYKIAVALVSLLIVAVVFLGLKFFAGSVMTRMTKQQDEMQLRELQARYQYYDDRLKDEERVRAIYHDMKNHLLVLESKQNTEETRRMAQELRSQIVDYENYVHTGNEFLDIIIKDKAKKAREKRIDFSVAIDFSGVDFIEPLDISTLFGNGIDNAIEACEKLRSEDRVILVKAGRVQNFVSILIENNCAQEAPSKGSRTTKADTLLHGFGLSNMQKAAEKYGGACTTNQADGRFTLKILIPVKNEPDRYKKQ